MVPGSILGPDLVELLAALLDHGDAPIDPGHGANGARSVRLTLADLCP
jgi:hypothetical protein